jgi:hypothetical protein
MPTMTETSPLNKLYEKDETAWLDRMAALAEQRQTGEMDFDNLAEFLTSMATRDRHEVESRLIVLLLHLLKWEFQPEKQSRSWNVTIRNQRRDLARLLRSGTLSNYAEEVLPSAYRDAVQDAAEETGLPETTFPPACPWTVDQLAAEE